MSKPLKIQVVELARTLIAEEEHWCSHHLALDKNGIVVNPTSSLAIKRCALGAVLAAACQLTHDLDTAYKLGDQVLAPFCRPALLMDLNDTLGHAAVLTLFDDIIVAS